MKYFFRSTKKMAYLRFSIFGTMLEEADGNLIMRVISKALSVTLTYSQLVKFQIRLIFTFDIDKFLEYDVTKLLGQWNRSNSGTASIEIKKL